MIINTTKIRVPPENRKELYQTILPLLDPIRCERGCLNYRFYVDTADENSTLLIGEWETRADLDNHLRSNDFAILVGAISVLSGPESIESQLLASIAGRMNLITLVEAPFA